MFATCTFCSLKGVKMESHTAVRTSNGRISCTVCKKSTPEIVGNLRSIFNEPQPIRDIVAELIATDDGSDSFHLTGITSGDGHGAVAQGLGPDDILTTVILACGNSKVEISYTGNDIKSAAESKGTYGSGYSFSRSYPAGVDKAALILESAGFSMVASDDASRMRHLTFVKGTPVQGKSAIIGIRAQMTWSV